MPSPIVVFSDFDGTIARPDPVDLLLDRLADPEWRVVEERWARGEIGSRECMARQIPLIRGGWEAIVSVLATVEVDPSFAGFSIWCREHGIPLHVVSEGLDRVIHHLLGRDGITVSSVRANQLVDSPSGELSIRFPYEVSGSCSAGLCKCSIVRGEAGERSSVLIGDGQSDFCAAGEARYVFARGSLLRHCRANGIHCLPFDGFGAVQQVLSARIGEPALGGGTADGAGPDATA
ncbi:MAG: 2-hydroxy-3-keto-5-methylthiopentenyl-phosphate phosphatase [Candidatus Binatota bacterium]|jgi:2,3-diketo-5-methylthio-1-phosphopentane phosphatase|nr:2-hydroxy-3-keto-5-methylthiopentenyl-phosphate phosphatase [Candidatus Binatota bacterium]